MWKFILYCRVKEATFNQRPWSNCVIVRFTGWYGTCCRERKLDQSLCHIILTPELLIFLLIFKSDFGETGKYLISFTSNWVKSMKIALCTNSFWFSSILCVLFRLIRISFLWASFGYFEDFYYLWNNEMFKQHFKWKWISTFSVPLELLRCLAP